MKNHKEIDMQLFVVRGDGMYANGMAIVAANTHSQASSTLRREGSSAWRGISPDLDIVHVNKVKDAVQKGRVAPGVLFESTYIE